MQGRPGPPPPRVGWYGLTPSPPVVLGGQVVGTFEAQAKPTLESKSGPCGTDASFPTPLDKRKHTMLLRTHLKWVRQ